VPNRSHYPGGPGEVNKPCALRAGYRVGLTSKSELTGTIRAPGPGRPASPSTDAPPVAGRQNVATATAHAPGVQVVSADQATLRAIDARLAALVADGPVAFAPSDVGTLFTDTLAAIDLLTRGVPCRRY
jgi:hypothetical protein